MTLPLGQRSVAAPPPADQPVAPRTLVIGLGSQHGDDAAGWHVVRLLRQRLPRDIAVLELSTPVELLDVVQPSQRLVVCDACRGLGPPGSLHRLVWPCDRLAALRTATTHALGLVETLEVARALSRGPTEVILWTLEIDSVGALRQLSPAVAAAVPRWADAVAAEVLLEGRGGHNEMLKLVTRRAQPTV